MLTLRNRTFGSIIIVALAAFLCIIQEAGPLADSLGDETTRLIKAGIIVFPSQLHIQGPDGTPITQSGFEDDFRKWFTGKQERIFENRTLYYYDLSEFSANEDIVANVGGEGKAETDLSEFYSLIKAQGHGEVGPLVYGKANVFYIRDVDEVLRGVGVQWSTVQGKWLVMSPRIDPDMDFGWESGTRIFFSKPAPKPDGVISGGASYSLLKEDTRFLFNKYLIFN